MAILGMTSERDSTNGGPIQRTVTDEPRRTFTKQRKAAIVKAGEKMRMKGGSVAAFLRAMKIRDSQYYTWRRDLAPAPKRAYKKTKIKNAVALAVNVESKARIAELETMLAEASLRYEQAVSIIGKMTLAKERGY